MTPVQPAIATRKSNSPTKAKTDAATPKSIPGVPDGSILLFDDASNRLLGLVDGLDDRGFKLKGHQPITLNQYFLARLEAPAALLSPLVLKVSGRWSEITIESGIFLSTLAFEPLTSEELDVLSHFRAL